MRQLGARDISSDGKSIFGAVTVVQQEFAPPPLGVNWEEQTKQ
jgi:hypothetical protein